MAEITVRRVTRRAGKIYVRWSDKVEQEFDSAAQLRDHVREALSDGGLKAILRTLLLAQSMKSASDGGLLESLEGKSLECDLSTLSVTVK